MAKVYLREQEKTLYISAPSSSEDEITMFIKCLWEVDSTFILQGFWHFFPNWAQFVFFFFFFLPVFIWAKIICFIKLWINQTVKLSKSDVTYWCMLITITATNRIVLCTFSMLSHATCLHNRLCVWMCVCDSSYSHSIMRQADSTHENCILWNTCIKKNALCCT